MAFGKKPEEPADPKKGFSMFKKKDNHELIDSVADLSALSNSLSRRTRVSEERIVNINRKIQLADQNSMGSFKKIHTELRSSSDELIEVKKELSKMKMTMDLIIKELKLSAKKEDVNVLQRYINMWDPVKFVSQNEVEKIVKRILER